MSNNHIKPPKLPVVWGVHRELTLGADEAATSIKGQSTMKIIQLVPDTKETFAFYGKPNTIGTPVKVRFFALYEDNSVKAFVIDNEGLNIVPADTLENFLYLA